MSSDPNETRQVAGRSCLAGRRKRCYLRPEWVLFAHFLELPGQNTTPPSIRIAPPSRTVQIDGWMVGLHIPSSLSRRAQNRCSPGKVADRTCLAGRRKQCFSTSIMLHFCSLLLTLHRFNAVYPLLTFPQKVSLFRPSIR